MRGTESNTAGTMWHFVDLDHNQKLERRRLLDLYGALAQISALLPLVIIQIYFLTTWLHVKWSRIGNWNNAPGSPYIKKQRSKVTLGIITRLRIARTKALWWAGDTVEVWGLRTSKGEIVGAIAWTIWLIFLSCHNTQDGRLFSVISKSHRLT